MADTNTIETPREFMLRLFDARTKRCDIIQALLDARERALAAVRNPDSVDEISRLEVWTQAVQFMRAMPQVGMSDARMLIEQFDVTQWVTETTLASEQPALEPVVVDVSPSIPPEACDPSPAVVQATLAEMKQFDAAQSAPEPEPAPEPAPESKPAPATAEPTEARVDTAREKALAETPANPGNVYDKCVWLRVRFRRLGNSRDASEDVTVQASDGSEAGAKTRTSKLILQDCKEWRAIQAQDNAFRIKVKGYAVPSQLSGIYPIPLDLMEQAEREIAEYEAERLELVKTFVVAYPDAVKADKDTLGALWKLDDYPPTAIVQACYKMAATWVDMSQSTRLTTAMAARNARAAQEEQREAFAEVRAALRLQVATILDDLIGALKPDETGKRRSFQDVRITKLRDWCLMFRSRDITGDATLQGTVDKIRDVLEGVTDAKSLRENDAWRDELANKLDTARGELRTLGVVDAPARKFRKRAAVAAITEAQPWRV